MEKRTIFITRGLPACGKSTYSKEYVLKDQKTKRINRDDLRTMLSGYILTWNNEHLVLDIEETMIKKTLLYGFNVISDNTYIKGKHLTNLIKLVREIEMENPNFFINIVLVDFTDVSFETCVERDSKRERPVGREVIEGFNKMLNDPNNSFNDIYATFLEERDEKRKTL
ncbi:MAG: AAA family ATPase [Richelia sp. RM2_1_2]|nr:AAA family ATPase [Richelia sp. RM2_1_2]